MKLFNSIPFRVEDKDYDIRILYNKSVINVVAFNQSYPTNGYRYQVKIPKKCNAKKLLEKSPVPDLVEKCKRDLVDNTWQQFSKFIIENKTTVHPGIA